MSKKMTDENKKLVSEFFRKAQMIANAASEMSSILDAGGPIPNSTKLSAILYADDNMPKQKKKGKSKKNDTEACKCYLLAHILMINGIEGSGFISKKGKVKKYFNPMKKKHRDMSLTWGKGPVSTSSYRFRVRYASNLMSWMVENYDDLNTISKRTKHCKGYSGGLIHAIMTYIKMVLDDRRDEDECEVYEQFEQIDWLGMVLLLVGDDMRKSHINKCYDKHHNNAATRADLWSDLNETVDISSSGKAIKKLIKITSLLTTGHTVKIPDKISKAKNIIDSQKGREIILRAIGDVLITCADKGDISPIYLAYVRSNPKLIGYSSKDDVKVRAGRQALNYLLYVMRDVVDNDVKNFIKKILR